MSQLPQTCLPTWEVDELPIPKPLGWRNLIGLIGPGIVMCGIQIGGGEWLLGPDVTARYGGGLMWIATVAIALQVFYNLECGRYALYTGEPVFTGMMRTKPGPNFWIGVAMLLSSSSLVPGLSTNAAVLIVAILRGQPPTVEDKWLINTLALVLLGLVIFPVLLGGKVYNTLQAIMTAKVVTVLGFCLIVGVLFVGIDGWRDVFSGFLGFGNVPVKEPDGTEKVVNVFTHFQQNGTLPIIALANIATLGAFAGYAGGGGLSNSTYSNFVRDKGWGMGQKVGAIPSAIGGRGITLSHIGKVFELTDENLKRWKLWWKYIIFDQAFVWAPGCVMGMALPALLSIEFAQYSPLFNDTGAAYRQALIVADGMRLSGSFGEYSSLMWILALLVGMMVFLPSQVSIVDDFSRRWTDILWSSSPLVRRFFKQSQVSRVYYALLAAYVTWSFIAAFIFLSMGDAPKAMVLFIANFNNLAIGYTAFHILYINVRFLPEQLRPRWYSRVGMLACGLFYMSLAILVFFATVWPELQNLWTQTFGIESPAK